MCGNLALPGKPSSVSAYIGNASVNNKNKIKIFDVVIEINT
jgi:hypothetical protein